MTTDELTRMLKNLKMTNIGYWKTIDFESEIHRLPDHIKQFVKNQKFGDKMLSWRQFMAKQQNIFDFSPERYLYRIFSTICLDFRYNRKIYQKYYQNDDMKSVDRVARSIAFFLYNDFIWENGCLSPVVNRNNWLGWGKDKFWGITNRIPVKKLCLLYYVVRQHYYYQLYQSLYNYYSIRGKDALLPNEVLTKEEQNQQSGDYKNAEITPSSIVKQVECEEHSSENDPVLLKIPDSYKPFIRLTLKHIKNWIADIERNL